MKAASHRIALIPQVAHSKKPFYIARRDLKMGIGMFHVKHGAKGYYSANFFCETFLAIASDKVIKG